MFSICRLHALMKGVPRHVFARAVVDVVIAGIGAHGKRREIQCLQLLFSGWPYYHKIAKVDH